MSSVTRAWGFAPFISLLCPILIAAVVQVLQGACWPVSPLPSPSSKWHRPFGNAHRSIRRLCVKPSVTPELSGSSSSCLRGAGGPLLQPCFLPLAHTCPSLCSTADLSFQTQGAPPSPRTFTSATSSAQNAFSLAAPAASYFLISFQHHLLLRKNLSWPLPS